MTMEAWLSELEMEWDSEEMMVLNNNFYNNPSEELDIFLSEDFHFSSSGESYSPIAPKNMLQNPTKLSQCIQTQQLSPPLVANIYDTNCEHQNLLDTNKNDKEDCKQPNENAKRKRKREASGAYHHIVAERKRRELHSQRFIALSALVPNLKKVDKGSILVETINYLKSLQGKVKELEEKVTTTNSFLF